MKDTVITAAVKRRELWIWLTCFIAANVVNITTIICYSTPWYEVFTQLGYVVALSVLLYVLTILVRVVWFVVRRLTSHGEKH